MDRGKVEIISVIRTTLTTRGSGQSGDGLRTVTQYWSLAGKFLFEDDPAETGRGEVVYLDAMQTPAADGAGEIGYGD